MYIHETIRLEQSGLMVDVTVEDAKFDMAIRPLDQDGMKTVLTMTDQDVGTLCSFLGRLRTKMSHQGLFYVEGYRERSDGREVLMSVGPVSYCEAERIWRDQSFRHVDDTDVAFEIMRR